MQRERRQHAGNRMQSLISGQIQVEELFENAAVEEENDDEFVFMEEQDEFDSDFASESENEGEDDEGEKDLDKEFTEQEVKKKKAKDFLLNLKKSQTVKPAPEKKKPERKQKVAPWNFGEHIPSDETEFGVRSVRKTTKNRSEMVESKLLEKQKKREMIIARTKKKPKSKKLSQDQLLAEAKFTEEYNIASLEMYRQWEEEKKKVVKVSKDIKGPIIHFHSFPEEVQVDSVTGKLWSEVKKEEFQEQETKVIDLADDHISPKVLIKQVRSSSEIDMDVTEDRSIESTESETKFDANTEPTNEENTVINKEESHPITIQQTRNLVTFVGAQRPLDEWRYVEPYPKAVLRRGLCPITGLPAKYRDPMTGIHYANVQAFKILRAIMKDQYLWDPKLSAFVSFSKTV